MSPQLCRQGFGITLFIILLSGMMLFFQRPGTAEFVITASSFAIGLMLMTLLIILIKREAVHSFTEDSGQKTEDNYSSSEGGDT